MIHIICYILYMMYDICYDMIQVVLPGMTNVWADTTQILLRFDLNIRDKWRLNSDYSKKILFENISILSIYRWLAELTKYFVMSSHL